MRRIAARRVLAPAAVLVFATSAAAHTPGLTAPVGHALAVESR